MLLVLILPIPTLPTLLPMLIPTDMLATITLARDLLMPSPLLRPMPMPTTDTPDTDTDILPDSDTEPPTDIPTPLIATMVKLLRLQKENTY
jgi:hypothetical protein